MQKKPNFPTANINPTPSTFCHSDRSPVGAKWKSKTRPWREPLLQTAYLAQFSKESCPLLCKTNPIVENLKSPQPVMPQGLTQIFRPAQRKKTNPNKANSPNAIRDTQYAIRNSSPTLFLLTSTTPSDYNGTLSQISCLFEIAN